MTIKEIEQYTGLPRASIRYYETQKFFTPVRGDNGYRDYSRQDADTLLKIKLLRQLHFSLEDIHALQNGEQDLDAALQARIQALKGEQLEAEQAALLCQTMWEDRVSYPTLNARRYLDRLAQGIPNPRQDVFQQDQLPQHPFHWRRCFARGFDNLLLSTLWTFFLQIAFHINYTLRPDTMWSVFDTVVVLGLMLGTETLLLHTWGTTPGKALFGLRIVRQDGSLLSLEEAFLRTVLVVLFYGACKIPVIGFFCLLWAYWTVTRTQQPLPWESEEQVYLEGSSRETPYWSKKSSYCKIGGYVLCYAACIGLLVLGHLGAATPPNHGQNLTIEQFVENYNWLNTFYNGPKNVSKILQDDGILIDTNPSYSIDFRPWENILFDPQFIFSTDADGFLNAVTISQSYQRNQEEKLQNTYYITPVPINEVSLTNFALLWGRLGNWRIMRTNQQIANREAGSFHYDLPSVQLDCTLEFSGFYDARHNNNWIQARETKAQSYNFTYTAALERAEGSLALILG